MYKRTFIVAELSANHKQKIDIAINTIKAMKDAGADAVKLQTYTPETITIDCDNEYFQIKQGTLWDGLTLYKLYEQAYTPWEWHAELKKVAEEAGLVFFSTPFDKSAVDFLEELNVPLYKIASFEITDIPFIEYIAAKGKPVIMSTGIASLKDIEEAVAACRQAGNKQITLLKCTSSYPASLEDANLLTMKNMAETFDVDVGLSDHTLSTAVAIAAVVLGAKIIEKHFILDKKLGSPDAAFSLDPQEFKGMVKGIREAEQALGSVDYKLPAKVKASKIFARSLFVVNDIKKDEIFSENNIRSIRPGFGLSPKYLNKIHGKRAKMDLKRGTPLKWDFIS